ncbi:MAG: hypothetical protein QOG04_1481 [Actinomycetota bacterium]|jgi:hypothetical protein|nr:hypothetical protein [Actinomycetota bacterium]
MIRWLLNSFTTWVLAFIVVGGFALLAGVSQRAVHRFLPKLVVTPDNDLPSRLISVLMGMFGLMLAFVVVSQYQDLKESELNVRAEANHLEQLHVDTQVFDEEMTDRMEVLIGHYLHSLVEREWDLMRDGRSSAQASDDLSDIDTQMQSYEPKGATQSVYYGNAVGELDAIRDLRRSRLEEAGEELPLELQLVIMCGALLLVFFLGCFGSDRAWSHTLMVMAVSALAGFNLLLLITLDHPFSGEISVSNHVFMQGELSELF